MHATPSKRTLGASILLLALTLVASPVLFAQAGGPMNGFARTGDYLLELDGSMIDDARVYRSSSAQAVLIVASDLPAPVLIRPRFRTVEKVSLLKMNEKQDGSIDLLPNPTYASEESFSVDGSDVVFSVEGRAARLKLKPAISGFQTPAAIFDDSPEYEQRAGFYTPDASVVEELRAQGKEVRVQIFFGTWCPACGQMVPRILKVAEQTRGSKLQFAFYGLEREFSGDAEASRLGIRSVPTGVIWVDGEEAGRLVGNDWRSPEKAISDLIDG